jgi:hypothetical protein
MLRCNDDEFTSSVNSPGQVNQSMRYKGKRQYNCQPVWNYTPDGLQVLLLQEDCSNS